MAGYDNEIARLETCMEEVRRIRARTCEPKANSNPRYLGLSNAVSGMNKAIDDMRSEGTRA
jgi:hypothetical protein